MTELTCVGLGLMGSALARAMLAAGHPVTVWNRSEGKTKDLVALGAKAAKTLTEALSASPVIVICIDSYASARDLLADVGHRRLAGRTVVQLTTGTPREAEEFAALVRAQGAHCLDGAILCGPPAIGTERGEVLVSGEVAAWVDVQPLLTCLAGKVRFVGESAGHAATLDLAWLTTRYTEFLGVAHAACICHSQGVSFQALTEIFPAGSSMAAMAAVIRDEAYGQPTATLHVWAEALQRIQTQARDAGISPAVPDFIAGYFRRALDLGLGQEKAIAIYKTFGTAGGTL